MHDAFEHVPILEKLPLQIDCLAAWGEPPPASRPETPPASLPWGRWAAAVGRLPPAGPGCGERGRFGAEENP